MHAEVVAGSEVITRFRNDGTGMFRDARPVVNWDERTGSNIVWKTALPNWSNSSPIVTRGRVFVISEARAGFPVLFCINARTGEIMWQREIDHLDALPPVRQREAREHWRKTFAAWPRFVQWQAAADAALKNEPADSGKAPPIAEKGAADGFRLAYDAQRKAWTAGFPGMEEAKEYGGGIPKYWPGRPYGGHWFGYAYPTPVADGESVYVAASYNAVVCFDLEGNRRWANWKRSGGAHNGCLFAPSPILAGDYVVVQAAGRVRAIHRHTGVEAWSARANPNPEAGGGRTKVGTPVYLSCGLIVCTDGWIYRLSDGKLLAQDTLAGMLYETLAVDAARNTVFADMPWRKPGCHAVRYGLDAGGALLIEPLWHVEGKGPVKGMSPVFDGERLFTSGRVLEAATGKVLGEFPFEAKTDSGNMTGAGAYLFVRHGFYPGFTVFSAEREPKVVSRPYSAPNLSNPCFDGTRMFVRTEPHIYAVGDPSAPYEPSFLTRSVTAGNGFPGTQPPLHWADGNVLWRTNAPPADATLRAGPPAWTAGRLVGFAGAHRLAAWDADSGALLWEHDAGKESGAGAGDSVSGQVRPGVAVRDRSVFVTFANGRVACFGIEGDRRWICNPNAPQGSGINDATPVPGEETVVVQLAGLVGLDAASGAERWRVPSAGAGPLAAPVLCRLRNGARVLLTADGRLLRERDGASVAAGLPVTGRMAPIVGEGVAYLCVSGTATPPAVVALRLPDTDAPNQSGQILWTAAAGNARGFAASPLLHEGILYALPDVGGLLAIEAATGTRLAGCDLARPPAGRAGDAPCDFPALSEAGGRLYVPLGGEPAVTAVVTPGRESREIWRYAVSQANGGAVFRGDRQYVPTGGHLVCIGGPTPSEPIAPRAVGIEPDRTLQQTAAPMTPFADNEVPRAWLVCGPFPRKTPDATLQGDLPVPPDVRPISGLAVAHAGTTNVFRAVGPDHFWSEPRWTSKLTWLDLKGAVSNALHTTAAYYTVITNDRPRFVRFRMFPPNGEDWNLQWAAWVAGTAVNEKAVQIRFSSEWATWVAGTAVNEQDTYRLPAGTFPVLLQVAINRTKEGGDKIWAAPRLVDVTADHEALERNHEAERRKWEQYQTVRPKALVLSAGGIGRLEQ
jgi:outer membrane protein assembly factor BamB